MGCCTWLQYEMTGASKNTISSMGVEADDENRYVDTERAIDMALAEFEALRAEIELFKAPLSA